MKKIFCILSILSILSPVFADDDPTENPETPTQPGTPTQEELLITRELPSGFSLPNYGTLATGVASAAYVNGAYDAMDHLKENRLNDKTSNGTATNGDVVHATADYTGANANAPAKPFVASVSATNGVVNVVNAEVSIPVNSYTQPTSRAPIWVD